MGNDVVQAEIVQIEQHMRDDIGSYWADAGMQARYRTLLESGDEDDTPKIIPLPTLSGWRAAGNSPADYGSHVRLVKSANEILMDVPSSDADMMISGFDKLPVVAQGTIYRLLLDRRPIYAQPLPEADVALFVAEEPAFTHLAREWGDEAPEYFARAQRRLLTVLAILDDVDERASNAALRWFETLPTKAKTAVTRVLGRAYL